MEKDFFDAFLYLLPQDSSSLRSVLPVSDMCLHFYYAFFKFFLKAYHL